jgi:hypothetical protein
MMRYVVVKMTEWKLKFSEQDKMKSFETPQQQLIHKPIISPGDATTLRITTLSIMPLSVMDLWQHIT